MNPLLTAAKRGAEAAPAVMRGPDGEWILALMYVADDGTVRTAGFSPELLLDDNVVATQKIVLKVLMENKASQAALIAPVWVAAMGPDFDPGIRARDRADREERVMVTYVTQDSTRVETARVLRSETEKPSLGPWDLVYEGLEVGGGFADIMRAGVSNERDE